MSRRLLLGLIGVLVLAGGSLVAIELMLRPGGSTGGSAPETIALPQGAPQPGFPGAEGTGGPPGSVPTLQQWRPLPAPEQAPLPRPPKGSWEEVPVANLRRERTPEIVAVSVALQAAQVRLSACFDEDTQARFGPQAHTTMDHAPADDPGQPMLLLEIESRYDEVVVVDAPVEAVGKASDGLLACAQSVLRGLRVPAPGVRPGKRTRMRHLLVP